MKNITDVLHDQSKALGMYKKQNFGSIPDDYRDMIENIIAEKGPATFLFGSIAMAASKFPQLIETLKETVGAAIKELGEDGNSMHMAMTIDGDKVQIGSLIRKNWELFEPAFMFLYLGLKMGRQMEREEREELLKLVTTTAHESPSATPEAKPKDQVLLPAVSDSHLPAVSPENADTWARELEAELGKQGKGDDKKSN